MAIGVDGPCKDVAQKARDACSEHSKIKSRPKAIEAMCADDDCKAARACVLSPYSPSNCCDGKTGHHVVPVHCFMPPGARKDGVSGARYAGCEKYNMSKAPCICVTGHDKSTGEHKLAHDSFDTAEDRHMVNGKAGSWTYKQASETGAKSVNDATGCDEACTKAQVDRYHKDQANIKDDTPLRADSAGTRTPGDFVPFITRSARRG